MDLFVIYNKILEYGFHQISLTKVICIYGKFYTFQHILLEPLRVLNLYAIFIGFLGEPEGDRIRYVPSFTVEFITYHPRPVFNLVFTRENL